jgi:hypothetical protein
MRKKAATAWFIGDDVFFSCRKTDVFLKMLFVYFAKCGENKKVYKKFATSI